MTQTRNIADVGLEVDIVAPADPSAPPKLVAAGQADIAIGAMTINYAMSASKVSSTNGLCGVLVEPSGFTPMFWESG